MESQRILSKTGRPLTELTLERILTGELTTDDLAIAADTLGRQADVAEAAGYRQYAENLRRAAELSRLSNEEVLEIYRALRPGRATRAHLVAIAERLEGELEAPRCAALVREAAEIYLRRRLIE